MPIDTLPYDTHDTSDSTFRPPDFYECTCWPINFSGGSSQR